MRARWMLLTLSLSLPAAAQASAEGEVSLDGASAASSSNDSDALPGALVVGGEVGAIFPQPFSELGTHVAFGLELGYRLPFAGQRIEIMAAGTFAPPGNTQSIQHGTPGEETAYSGEIDQQELTFSLGPRFRIMDRASPWNVTLAAGGRMFLLRTWSSGSRGNQEFAEFTEESTQFGFFVAVGGEYTLGPGAIFLDVDFGWSDLPHRITGDVSTGNLTPTLGFRLFLL